jgi:probable rRNA maturation factor
MEPPSRTSVSILNQSGLKPIPRLRIERAIASAVTSDRAVSVLITTDEEIRSLNAQFRNLDEPTDVLTFPAPDFPGSPLGEIVISVDTAQRQAELRHGKFADELVTLALHGALHLAGFDDETPADRQKMLARQNEICGQLGLPQDQDWSSLHYAEAAR